MDAVPDACEATGSLGGGGTGCADEGALGVDGGAGGRASLAAGARRSVSREHGEPDGLGEGETRGVEARALLFVVASSVGIVGELAVEGAERGVGLVEGREGGRDGVGLRDIDGFHALGRKA